MKIELRKGDITNQPDIDAIVNAANTELWMGSGVAGAIDRRGGPEIEREARAKGPINLGEAVETTAGNLPNRYVIHAAAMGYRREDAVGEPGMRSNETIIRKATINSLSLAERLGCRSIAFPALATGVGGFPVEDCAKAMLSAVRQYDKENPQSIIHRVVFVLFTSDAHATFDRVFRQLAAD